jgi:hypothetical protein
MIISFYRGILAVFLFLLTTIAAGAFYEDYVCYDIVTGTWGAESQMSTISYLSMSCIPTGMAYAFRDFIHLSFGRKVAIVWVLIASFLSVAISVYGGSAYLAAGLSGLVFLVAEGIDQYIYETIEARNVSFASRLIITGTFSGFVDAIFWKSYLDIFELNAVILSGLLMAAPALVFAVAYKLQNKKGVVYE